MKKVELVGKICPSCGQVFYKRNRKGGYPFYCSQKCHGQSRVGIPISEKQKEEARNKQKSKTTYTEVPCVICGVKMLLPPWQVKIGKKTCSHGCAVIYMRQNKSEEHKNKLSLAKKGKPQPWVKNYNRKRGRFSPEWKGDQVGYVGLHMWVRRNFDWPKKCELCGEEKRLNLASKNYKYTRNKEDWWILCYWCHRKYDLENGWGIATKKYNLNK